MTVTLLAILLWIALGLAVLMFGPIDWISDFPGQPGCGGGSVTGGDTRRRSARLLAASHPDWKLK